MTTTQGLTGSIARFPVLRAVDCITVPVPDLDTGLAFYRDTLGHQLRWRNDERGQAALALPEATAELVLTTREPYAPAWLVASADEAAATIQTAGGRIITEPFDIPVGRVALAADPFGNVLVLIDLSKGQYLTNATGTVTGTTASPAPSG